jgi:hypothetical protein
MPATPTARPTADGFATRRAWGNIPDVLEALRADGDERLALDSLTQRDVYGCCDRPETDAVLFASSTASSVSERGLAAAQIGWLQLAAGQSNPSASLPDWFDAIRGRILKYCGALSADCILAASGTDSELIAAALAVGRLRRPLTNIVLAPSETGRGVPIAAEGRHFQDDAPFAAGVGARMRLAGWERADIRVETVEIRDAAGAPRTPSAVECDVRARVRAAIASGRGALVHVIDVSKTGLEGLSIEAARRIAAETPDRTLVVADCCQLRCSTDRLRALLDAGFLVALTGSKFAGGAPFSAALVAPERWLAHVDVSLLPAGLGAHTAWLDWPPDLRPALEASALRRANFGLGLRWLTALGELERFAEIDPALVRKVRARFRSDVARSAERLAHVSLDACDCDAMRWADTIATVRLRRGDGGVVFKADAQRLRAALREPMTGAGKAAARRFHVGQPVAMGEEIALRICLSVPLINAVADRIDSGSSFDAAYAPLAADIDALFEKWRLVAERLGGAEASRVAA